MAQTHTKMLSSFLSFTVGLLLTFNWWAENMSLSKRKWVEQLDDVAKGALSEKSEVSGGLGKSVRRAYMVENGTYTFRKPYTKE